MGFVHFMRSSGGRLLRVLAGAALIGVGIGAIGGAAGIVVAVIGIVPLLAGIFNFCLFGPLFGVDLWGRTRPDRG